MAYYAIQHTYGANMRDNDGYMIGAIVKFANRLERDAWVADGGEWRNKPGYRSVMTVRGFATLRKAIKAGDVIVIDRLGA